jgi:hypothetical protein
MRLSGVKENLPRRSSCSWCKFLQPVGLCGRSFVHGGINVKLARDNLFFVGQFNWLIMAPASRALPSTYDALPSIVCSSTACHCIGRSCVQNDRILSGSLGLLAADERNENWIPKKGRPAQQHIRLHTMLYGENELRAL